MNQADKPELIDLSCDGTETFENSPYRAIIDIPWKGSEDVSFFPIIRFVNNHLKGRDPFTTYSYSHEKIVTMFGIEKPREETMQQIGHFATSLAEVLVPLVQGEPTISIEFLGNTYDPEQ